MEVREIKSQLAKAGKLNDLYAVFDKASNEQADLQGEDLVVDKQRVTEKSQEEREKELDDVEQISNSLETKKAIKSAYMNKDRDALLKASNDGVSVPTDAPAAIKQRIAIEAGKKQMCMKAENVGKKEDFRKKSIPDIEQGKIKVQGKSFDIKYVTARDNDKLLNSITEQIGKCPRYAELAVLRREITNYLIDKYGGYNNVTMIAVADKQMFLNNTCLMVNLHELSEEIKDRLPIDLMSYVDNGLLEPLFDWSTVRKMKKLRVLVIDDINVYDTDIASDLDIDDMRLGTIFNQILSLKELYLSGKRVERENQHSQEAEEIRYDLAQKKRWNGLLDGYKLNYKATDGIMNFGKNSLCNYVKNRGNKGFLRFCCGTGFRLVFCGVTGCIGLGARMIGSFHKWLNEDPTHLTEQTA